MGSERLSKYRKMHEVNVFLELRDDSILNMILTRVVKYYA